MTATTPTVPPSTPTPSSLTYTRYELIRMLRNVRFFLFSLVFPLVLYLLIVGPNRHVKVEHVPFALYYMTGLLAWGAMSAVIAGGARIALERSIGWNRQLRVTPLTTRSYLTAKVLTGYLMAAASIVLLYGAGLAMGVHLSAAHWVTMTIMVLVGLVPFAALGILLGHVVSADAMGPAMGGITAMFAFLGGSWGPIATGGFLRKLTELLPSYWLVQAGKTAIGGSLWPAKAWIVLAVWTAVMSRLAVRAWQRDTQRA
jgi:ABC-2 type transport system permease protein